MTVSEKEYEPLAEQFMPKEDVMEEWVLAAKDAGAKYLIMVTRHHDGFRLWDSKINPYNSCNFGCKRDLVHPDCERAAYDPNARWFHCRF